jgi:hypothetical protein
MSTVKERFVAQLERLGRWVDQDELNPEFGADGQAFLELVNALLAEVSSLSLPSRQEVANPPSERV